MEHHSNIVPWQMVTARSGATLRWFGLTDEGRLDLSNIDQVITERTKVVSFVLVSNILGTVNPAEELVRRAHEVGALVVVDASQSVPHMPVDVQALGADFVAFTGHKMCGPTGIGVLWGRKELLEELPPFLGGGEMIEAVDDGRLDLRRAAAQVRGRHAADRAGGRPRRGCRLPVRARHGRRARARAADHRLRAGAAAAGARGCGSSARPTPEAAAARRSRSRSATCTRTTSARSLDELGIAVRVGHHCARPVCLRFGVPATTRASFYLYTTTAEVDALVDGLEHGARASSGAAMKLESLYQEIILDHYRTPHHKGLREPFDAEVHHVNPTCGDEVTLRVKVDGDVRSIRTCPTTAMGCSISQASASVMTDLVIGKSLAEGDRGVRGVPRADAAPRATDSVIEPDEDVLEDAVAFAGVSKYPARIKCALLGWMAWKDATARAVDSSTTTEETA